MVNKSRFCTLTKIKYEIAKLNFNYFIVIEKKIVLIKTAKSLINELPPISLSQIHITQGCLRYIIRDNIFINSDIF